jgi:hypothetical protein
LMTGEQRQNRWLNLPGPLWFRPRNFSSLGVAPQKT